MMGPQAKEVQWANTICKWDARSRDIVSSRCGPTLAAFRYNFIAVPVLRYKAQLLPPPDGIHTKERFMLHRILHTPPNTFELNTFFQMESMGGPPVQSVGCYCRSSMFRAAHSTIKGWEMQLQSLKLAATEHLPLCMFGNDFLAPPCWDTPPIVLNLSRVYHGTDKPEIFLSPTKKLKQQLKTDRLSFPGPPPRIQGLAYRFFVSLRVPSNFEHFLKRRISSIADCDIAALDHINIPDTLDCLRGLDKFNAVCWLKTVCNGWNTSFRLHSEVLLECIFGCQGCKDELQHYLSCEVLLALISEQFSCVNLGPTPLLRLNLIDPSPQKFVVITAMYNMYHTLKVGHRDVVDRALLHNRFEPCCQIAGNVARDYHSQFSHIFSLSALSSLASYVQPHGQPR